MVDRRVVVRLVSGLRQIIGVLPRGHEVPPTVDVYQVLRQTNTYVLYALPTGTKRAARLVSAT